MTRIVKTHDERRSEILDAAQKLFYSKGFKQTSIRDIIDSVGIAKGTFYHYFSSKTELLDELIERMLGDTMQMVEPIVEDENLDALQKLHLFFATIENWKVDNRAFFKDLLRVFYNDDNIVLRQRLKAASIAVTGRPLAKIIRQGVQEGVFDTGYPDEIGEVIIVIGQSLAEKLAYYLLDDDVKHDIPQLIQGKIAVTNNSLERLLGTAAGSVNIFDFDRLQPWFAADDFTEERTSDIEAAAAVLTA